MGYKGLLSHATSTLPWNFSNKDNSPFYCFSNQILLYFWWHECFLSNTLALGDCKVSLFSFEKKRCKF